MDSSPKEPASDSLDVADKRDMYPNTKNLKRRRKNSNPKSFNASGSISLVKSKDKKIICCKNLACQARLNLGDTFCKRCSCCICQKFDDNKDPSLWLTCNSDPPFSGESCGFSCHLDCAFKTEKSGIMEDKPNTNDGCFYCFSCGKRNTLLECWTKQFLIAKETRSVDVLFDRLLLAQKLLQNTKKYVELSETVTHAVKALEAEFESGPLTDLPSSMRRGNVNKLSSWPEVNNLCSSALTFLEDLELSHQVQGSTKIRFEDVNETSITLILGSEESSCSSGNIIHHSVWHRKVSEEEYPKESTCELFTLNTRFVVSGLIPATEYCFKVVSFSGAKELSVDEFRVSTQIPQEEKELTLANSLTLFTNDYNLSPEGKRVSFKTDKPEKAMNIEKQEKCGLGLEQCVKILRQLESSGYVEKDFRQKFLTWYSLRATVKEVNVVKTFVDVFKDDFIALAEQLVDTFSDLISRNRSPFGGCGSGAFAGFGMKPHH